MSYFFIGKFSKGKNATIDLELPFYLTRNLSLYEIAVVNYSLKFEKKIAGALMFFTCEGVQKQNVCNCKTSLLLSFTASGNYLISKQPNFPIYVSFEVNYLPFLQIEIKEDGRKKVENVWGFVTLHIKSKK